MKKSLEAREDESDMEGNRTVCKDEGHVLDSQCKLLDFQHFA